MKDTQDTTLPQCPICGRPALIQYRCSKCGRLVCRECLYSPKSDTLVCKECAQ